MCKTYKVKKCITNFVCLALFNKTNKICNALFDKRIE